MLTRARRVLLALIAAATVMLPLTPAPAYALPANPNVSDEVIEANWATLSAEQQETARQVVAEAKAEGYSAEAAAAVAGNFWRESHPTRSTKPTLGASPEAPSPPPATLSGASKASRAPTTGTSRRGSG